MLFLIKRGKLTKLTSALESREKEAQTMNCKYCNEPLEDGVTLCPKCGMENAPMPELIVEKAAEEVTKQEAAPVQEPAEKNNGDQKQKKPAWKTVLTIICGVVLLGVLVCAALYGLGVIDFTAKEYDVTCKDSYTVSDKKALNKADMVIATAGGQTLTNGELQIYYSLEVVDFISNYSAYLSYYGLDYTKPLDEQYFSEDDGITWQHMFIDNALSAWHTYAILNLMAEDEDYPISQELQQTLDAIPQNLLELAKSNGYDTAQEMIEADFGGGCTADAYLSYLAEYYSAMAYFGDKYDSLTPTDAEISAYFLENQETLAESGIKKDSGKYVDVRHILIEPEGGTKDADGNTTYSDAEWDACYTSAKAILDEWLAGEATEDTFAEFANKHSADPGSNTSGGLYTQVVKGKMVEEFNDWIFEESRKYGDYDLVKTKFGYHIMYFVSSEDIWVAEVRSTILSERVDQVMEEAKERWPLETKYKKIVLSEIALS